MKAKQWQLAILAVGLGIWLCAGGAAAIERTAAPAPPPNHGAGLSIGERDMAAPYVPGTQEKEEYRLDARAEAALLKKLAAEKDLKADDIGGDDVIIHEQNLHRGCDVDIAANGDIYVVLETGDFAGEQGMELWMFRSQDGGTTWQDWGRFYPSETYGDLWFPSLHIAEGSSVQRCYLAYRHWEPSWDAGVIEVAYSDLSSSTGSWTVVTAMEVTDVGFGNPCITSDSPNYDPFYLYLVADGYETPGRDIWFARCTNGGTSFETPYRIAELSTDDRGYHDPTVSYGFGGYVHVAWHFEMNDESLDDAIRYRRASGFASAGIGGWDSIQYLTPNNNDMREHNATIRAARYSNEVLIASRRSSTDNYTYDPALIVSYDQGATFPDNMTIPGGLIFPQDIDQTSAGNWVLGGSSYYPWGPAIQRASAADPTVWSSREEFVDDNAAAGTIWGSTTTLDPTHGDRAAAVWVDLADPSEDPNMLKFDAEWRGDPGYPNLMSNFPVDLDHTPISPPALVDLNGNGTLEIVYGDDQNRIQAWHSNGNPVSGFPVDTGHPLSDGPVAVGGLTPSGRLFVVAGTADGWVVAYDAEGEVADGWPVNMGIDAPAYVSLGALGAPRVRVVVVCYSDRLTYRDYRGRSVPGFYAWRFLGDRFLNAPAAIGDIDGDGVNDVVVGPGNSVMAYDPREPSSLMSRSLAGQVSDQITLGDLDLDGEVEVIVPTDTGTLYALQEDGTDYSAAFPFTSPTGTPLTSAALAQCLSTWEPEICVAARNWTVHMLYGHSGEETPWSPRYTTTNWFLYGAPIVGRVDGATGGSIIGDRGMNGWAWSNSGAVVPGWPRGMDNRCQLSPALGDLDDDGLYEVVFLTLDQLIVYEINQEPEVARAEWPMYGHDPRRTGCSDCVEDLVSAVGEGVSITRVSFAQPSPNPMSSNGVFRFAVPVRSAASLEIFDLRGHRLRTILREEVGLGERIVTWDGRDGDGRRLATGQYFARLRVRGPGLNEDLVRKVMLLR